MTYVRTIIYLDSRLNRPSVSLASLARQLEKWFPLQGERAHSLNCVVVCMYVNRKEEE